LHLEIRSFGSTIPAKRLVVQYGGKSGNVFGILALGSRQAEPVYDIAQLFSPISTTYVQDFDSDLPSRTPAIATVTSLGPTLESGSFVYFGPNCVIQYVLSEVTPVPIPVVTATLRIDNYRINTALRQTPISLRSLQVANSPRVGPDPAVTPDPKSYQ
jgi:hypothetical protein